MSKKFKFNSSHSVKLNLSGKAKEFFDTGILTGAHIELFSNRHIIVDGCFGIADYGDDYIKLSLEKGALILYGDNFDIISLEEKIINIKGKIISLEFCM